MKLLVAIDGATRRNGKVDCVAAGGIFIQRYDDGKCSLTDTISVYEYGSTNQRGELMALLKALDYIHAAATEALIVTDSEYIFNAMTKNWCDRWVHNGWRNALNEPVKNADIWRLVYDAYNRCPDISFYHIKGHVIPFGKVTAKKLLHADSSGGKLLTEVLAKFDSVQASKQPQIDAAQNLSVKNNGFRLDDENFRLFVVSNTVADAIATTVVEAADAIPAAAVETIGVSS